MRSSSPSPSSSPLTTYPPPPPTTILKCLHYYWVPTMIRNKFCLDDLSQKRHLGHQEGGVTIDDDTGVTLTEFPDIQYNISSHSWQLLLKKYCRKTTLIACSPWFSPSGTWPSTTTRMGSGPVQTPSSWSSPMSRALWVGSRSILSIILTQWASEHCSFQQFYKGKWQKLWRTGLRCRTVENLLKPMLITFYYIYLLSSVKLFPIRALFIIYHILK